MIVGSLGAVIFQVSDSTVLTLRDLSIKNNATISIHKNHLGGGLAEFTGSEPQRISFKLLLSAYLGVNIEKQIGRLENYLRSGTMLSLVLGHKTYGRYRWLLESFTQESVYTDKEGRITQCDVSVSLCEYLKG